MYIGKKSVTHSHFNVERERKKSKFFFVDNDDDDKETTYFIQRSFFSFCRFARHRNSRKKEYLLCGFSNGAMD